MYLVSQRSSTMPVLTIQQHQVSRLLKREATAKLSRTVEHELHYLGISCIRASGHRRGRRLPSSHAKVPELIRRAGPKSPTSTSCGIQASSVMAHDRQPRLLTLLHRPCPSNSRQACAQLLLRGKDHNKEMTIRSARLGRRRRRR